MSYIRMTQEERVLVLINLTGEEKQLQITDDPNYGAFTEVAFQAGTDQISNLAGQDLTLAPYAMVVLQ